MAGIFPENQPPTRIIWGKNDQIFPAAGACLTARPDEPGIPLFDTGHFALEEDCEAIAELMRYFLRRSVKR